MLGNTADLDAAPEGIDGYLDEQTKTVVRLNRLSTPDLVVDAGAIPTYSLQCCALDWAHGRATVWFGRIGEDQDDGLCSECAYQLLSQRREEWGFVSVDVTR